jgi:hypothetical protein
MPARAAYVMTFSQIGSNVVVSGGGSIDISGLSLDIETDYDDFLVPNDDFVVLGAAPSMLDVYNATLSGPTTTFGSGGLTFSTTGTGDMVGIAVFNSALFVPLGYVSGTVLTDAETYAGQTFASLGLTPGTYIWTWGSGPTADSFTLQVGPVANVPEPSSNMLLGLPLGLLMLIAARPRRT